MPSSTQLYLFPQHWAQPSLLEKEKPLGSHFWLHLLCYPHCSQCGDTSSTICRPSRCPWDATGRVSEQRIHGHPALDGWKRSDCASFIPSWHHTHTHTHTRIKAFLRKEKNDISPLLAVYRSQLRVAGLLWLPGRAVVPLFPCSNTLCLMWSPTPDLAVLGVMEMHPETKLGQPHSHTEWDWNDLYSWAVTLPLSSPISSQWLTFHKMLCFIQEETGKKTHFSYLLFFALLSSTVLKTKLILDLVNLPFNMTMQRISFYLGFAFYKYFILSFVQSPSRTLATLSIFFRYLLSWSKNFLQIAQF